MVREEGATVSADSSVRETSLLREDGLGFVVSWEHPPKKNRRMSKGKKRISTEFLFSRYHRPNKFVVTAFMKSL